MIAFIPARGGSKGVPGKNIKELCGKPLIGYTIEACKNAKHIDRVIVTTDDEDIARVAKEFGAEVPFMRPDYLASDTASAVDVYIHAAEFVMNETGEKLDKFMVCLPTVPCRDSHHIDEAIEKFQVDKSTTLISFTEAEVPPGWYHVVDENGRVSNAGFGAAGSNIANRQTNATFYIPNGAIYILDYELLKEKRTYYCDNTTTYVMSREDSVDIDYPIDFEIAELMMEKKLNDNN
ncbi:acylneuraminate cytidylyltransferase family protein [Butyrivibrio fibrisolvens]|uniref:acylneuraminate cytidylyltransferase family protein n=1 Tax=Pseudobutyrivibrio ruminis TaxID=46206 RepID=UPI00041C2029|nr:acylneuraminate cytidylyltransferase family protein [Pseudobutyrivibrio ruminis]MDC7278862.1 acylneuraminate cytidylyltransferase family protein [Butyrivibrio fibrisolvens]